MDQLQQFLSVLLGNAVKHVYIQPPAGKDMEYPCVVIIRAPGETAFADNKSYRHQPQYQVTGISQGLNQPLYNLLAGVPRADHSRSFTTDNLNHDVFTIFF